MRELPFYTNWSYAHPRAIELAAEVASLAPGDLNRVFFVSGGSEAVESAWKLARQFHVPAASAAGRRSPARSPTTGRPWARSRSTGSRPCGTRSSRSSPACRTCATRAATTGRTGRRDEQFTQLLLDDLESAIRGAGPDTVAMVIMEPVQSAGGCFTPPPGYFQGVREICDRYQILLCADEVINGFGRLGAWFGSELYDIRPDLLTCAKGLSSAYASIGAVVAADHIIEPFLGEKDMYAHGITFGGHPVQAAIALKNLEIMKREDSSNVSATTRRPSTRRWPAARAADRRRPPRRGLLLGDRARQGQGDESGVLGRGVGDAPARVPARRGCSRRG